MNLWLAAGIVVTGGVGSLLLHELAAIAIEMQGTDFLPLDGESVSRPSR